ncbi:TIGR00366 family protein [Parvularcula flava]|uniref:Membrane protein n=1 Tax=Aquisalinus luteolus TaxID=1566827 RepID=A0A8J3A587_9PROT|nr:AbgT family transporter [Aquisalinus luteolus]NHK28708.1 TIGR00366 family protein [Aquisalinus luteolus]GGH99278.1 membrane protein [Aquisalinus luteolus]
MADAPTAAPTQKGFLGWVEKTGNKLPDPVFIFFYLIGALIVISLICWALGVSATHPTLVGEDGNPVVISAVALLSGDNIRRLWVDMPETFTHFHPLGYVLVVMLGAGVAERSGLFASAMRAAVRNAPKFLLTPVVALVAMIGNHAADAGYVVLIPLAGVLFAAAGRHPLAGIAAAFAGVSGGFSANIAPGQLDALLFGITEAAVEGSSLDPNWIANIAGNTYFIQGMTILFLPIIWFVTDVMIEPRLGKYQGGGDAAKTLGDEDKPLTSDQKKGLSFAGFAVMAVIVLWLIFTFAPTTPLIDETACPADVAAAGDCNPISNWNPFFSSLVAAFFILFLAAGWAYGAAAGTIKNHRDLVEMMADAMKDLGYYLVLAFAAAHFVAMFNWSNLGLISAVHGANAIQSTGLPMPVLLVLIVLFTGLINLFVGSASAKWALLAPVLVPMLMLLGISPEGATAAYRVGDSATNIITPLMVYFPLILIFCQRWQKDFGLGSLTAMMIPYSIWLMIGGIALTFFWVWVGWPLGPGADMTYTLPTAAP